MRLAGSASGRRPSQECQTLSVCRARRHVALALQRARFQDSYAICSRFNLWPSMIRHIVLFTAKDKAHIDQMIEGLSLLTRISHARRLEIARNRKADQFGNDI